jgi:hypothetical protein
MFNRTYHSIGYTVLFATLLVVITISLYTEYRPPDVLSRGGLLMYSRLEGWLLTNCLVTCPLFASGSVTNLTQSGCRDPSLNRYMRTEYSTPWLTVYLPSQRVGYLGDAQQLTVFVATETCFYFEITSWFYRSLFAVVATCSHSVTQAMDFSIPAFRRGLPSRCLVMDVSVSGVFGKPLRSKRQSVTIVSRINGNVQI